MARKTGTTVAGQHRDHTGFRCHPTDRIQGTRHCENSAGGRRGARGSGALSSCEPYLTAGHIEESHAQEDENKAGGANTKVRGGTSTATALTLSIGGKGIDTTFAGTIYENTVGATTSVLAARARAMRGRWSARK